MKYDWLEEKVKDLVRDLQWVERDACCEDDYDRLTDIAEDIIGGIPRYLLLIDYWTRYATRARMPETLQHNTRKINEIIDVICNNDTVSFDKSVALNIHKDIKQCLEEKTTNKVLNKLNELLADIECGGTDWDTTFDTLLEIRTMIEKRSKNESKN